MVAHSHAFAQPYIHNSNANKVNGWKESASTIFTPPHPIRAHCLQTIQLKSCARYYVMWVFQKLLIELFAVVLELLFRFFALTAFAMTSV